MTTTAHLRHNRGTIPVRIANWLDQGIPIAPLVVFRIVFGLLMLGSTIRFWALGWIEDHFIRSAVQFKYFGFEWVQLLPPAGMYALHASMALGALGIALGFYYRLSAVLFFLTFTYTELVDLTYYLNHYYFVSLVSLLLIFLPANRYFSIDAWRNPALLRTTTPRWTIGIIQFQLAVVYIFAGLAKINHAWLIEAMPLRIWLPANDAWPVIGPLFHWHYTPWLFSWAGMLYDCSIVFWLAWAKTRHWAYVTVVVFHALTGLMFQIGVFPMVMIGATLIFFPASFHEKILTGLSRLLRLFKTLPRNKLPQNQLQPEFQKAGMTLSRRGWIAYSLAAYVVFQLLFPWRYLLYPGNLFWTEEGYRFSWRVMLMEKAGTATFYVLDKRTGREGVVNNSDFLCAHQEKQMAMQPDMILQFAHFLAKHYAENGVANPSVRAEVYVTLNSRPSRLLIDPEIDLAQIKDTWKHKTWILPYEQ